MNLVFDEQCTDLCPILLYPLWVDLLFTDFPHTIMMSISRCCIHFENIIFAILIYEAPLRKIYDLKIIDVGLSSISMPKMKLLIYWTYVFYITFKNRKWFIFRLLTHLIPLNPFWLLLQTQINFYKVHLFVWFQIIFNNHFILSSIQAWLTLRPH